MWGQLVCLLPLVLLCFVFKYEVGKTPGSGLGTWLGIGNLRLKAWVDGPSWSRECSFWGGVSVDLSRVGQTQMGAF